MVNVGSLPRTANGTFDYDSHKGVTELLAAIRASNLTAEDKRELRDLVFLYTNGGKDQTVRRALEQKITTHQLVPVAPKVVVKPAPPPPAIGKFRPAPSFSVSATTPATTLPPAPSFAKEPAWKPASVPVVQKEIAPDPVIVPQPASAAVTEDYMVRIREIKAEVNEKVGNPVNLIDIDNAVGREYMAALLDAMKKLNAGGGAAPAMARLEAAFVSVKEALKIHQSLPAPMYNSTDSAPPPIPTITTTPYTTPVSPLPEAVPPWPPEPTTSENTERVVTAIPTSPATVERTQPVAMPLGEAAPPPPRAHFASVADLMDRPKSQSEPTSPASAFTATPLGDPLFSREVDEGLEQLLSEWSIFKKSGLFGTGPKGKEHPLFKKIAPLHIPLLLAGRFEGATQEIKQSITDYMNGWRYEQGLIYQQGETFEHYLRRVIRHILDLQKGKG